MCEQLKIVSITNFVLEPFISKYIGYYFGELDTKVSLSSIELMEYSCSQTLPKIASADMIFVAINFETLIPIFPEMGDQLENMIEKCQESCEKLYAKLKEVSQKQILWLGFEDYYMKHSEIIGTTLSKESVVDRINQKLCNMMVDEDIVIDLKRLIAYIGISNSYDIKNKYRWNALYSEKLVGEICYEIQKQYKISNGLTPKCVVVDCDNVIWGGILSEDGIENIRISESGLGRQYWDFQRFLLYLYDHGVLISICSKNDENEVHQVFKQHSGMVLKEDNIACFCVNWNNKSENVKKIANELNIGLDSIVFIDDSPYEVNEVSGRLPEVHTILYRRDTIFRDLACFSLNKKVDPKINKMRNDTFRTNSERIKLKEKSKTEQEFLSALKMNVVFNKTLSSELSRVSELSQRTNKCTNGVRYTVEELRVLMKKPEYELQSVYLSDCYSNFGLVGVIGIDNGKLDLFCLSCRALGRNIENKMIECVMREGTKNAKLKKTQKNEEIIKLFSIYGLKYDK